MHEQQDRKKHDTGVFYAIVGSLVVTRLLGIPVVLGGFGWAGNCVLEITLTIFLVCLFVGTKHETGIKLLIMGVAVGFVELFADHAAVASGTLIYNPHEPFLFSSPLYMPLIWLNRMVQIGFIGCYLLPRIGIRWTCLATAAIGGLVMPIGEWMAHQGGFWVYHSPKMVAGVPLYIIVCEFTTCALIVPVFRLFAERSRAWQLVTGAMVGVVILLSGEVGLIIETGKPFIVGVSDKVVVSRELETPPWERPGK